VTQFRADSATLKNLSDLHGRIAQYYRDAYTMLNHQSGTIVSALRNTNRPDAATQYEQWAGSLSNLQDEADAHQTWSDYLAELAQAVIQAESQLSS